MRNDTRKKFNHSLAKVAEINGVESAQVQFTVAPAPAQKMEEKSRLQVNFFKKLISSLLMLKLVKRLVYL